MRKFPINEEFPLTEEEKVALDKVLDSVEWGKYHPLKHLTSAYVESVVDGYDEFEIEVTITWGVDGQWSDFDYVTISRHQLLKQVPNGKSKS